MGNLKKVVGATGIVAGTAYLAKKLNSSYIKNLGKPVDTQDANMVDEGAMTSIQYYNMLQEEEQQAEAKTNNYTAE